MALRAGGVGRGGGAKNYRTVAHILRLLCSTPERAGRMFSRFSRSSHVSVQYSQESWLRVPSKNCCTVYELLGFFQIQQYAMLLRSPSF